LDRGRKKKRKPIHPIREGRVLSFFITSTLKRKGKERGEPTLPYQDEKKKRNSSLYRKKSRRIGEHCQRTGLIVCLKKREDKGFREGGRKKS